MKTILALLCLVSLTAGASQIAEVRVKTADGFGGDVSSVLARCQTKKGAIFDPVVIAHDVSELNRSGEFADITVDTDDAAAGAVVTFIVRRKYRFSAPLQVIGADGISESKVSSEAGLVDGYLYDDADLAAAAEKVRAYYVKKHYPDAKVSAQVKMIDKGNDCHVTLKISEGKEVRIRDYAFEGVKSVDESELREAIKDYPWWNPYGWFVDAPVSEEQLAECVAQIEEVYRNHGYLDVRVSLPKRVPVPDEPGKCDVVFKVAEGPQYRLGTYAIKGLTRYSEAAVKAKSELLPAGDVAGEKAIDDMAHRIQVTVGSGDSGLADTQVAVKRIPDAKKPDVVDIVFQVKEGVPVVIDNVVIRGNDYTMDKVIRREIALAPGDRMLEDRAERSQKRLENLDYFTRVRYYLESTDRGKDPSGAEYRNLVYEVEEKNTGSFMVGIGASSVDSVYVSAEVSQSNFDLFAPGKWFRGAGQKARAFVQWGPRIQTCEVSVTEPHLFDRLLEFTVEGYRRMRWYDDYDIIRSGAAATLSYPVKFWPTWNPFGRLGLRYTLEYVQFDDVTEGYYTYDGETVSLTDEEEEYGDAVESVVRLFWTRDTRDNFRMPTSGTRVTLFGDIAAGGDNEFWRVGLHYRFYYPVWKRYNHVLMVAFRTESIGGDDIPIYDRMFLGGPKSIRGVKYRNVSPFATSTWRDAIPWGGQTLVCANFEYTIPIVRMLRLAAFTDVGGVGDDELDYNIADSFAWTVGLGVRIDIPMFPIRLDFGVPLKKPDEADEEVFSFTVGYDF